MGANDWLLLKALVLNTQERQSAELSEIFRRLSKIDVALGQLAIKSGTWGAIGALIPTLIAFLFLFFKR